MAARRTHLRAQEEANVGTAVRNIAPWLLFVLVGTAPLVGVFAAGFLTGAPEDAARDPAAVAACLAGRDAIVFNFTSTYLIRPSPGLKL